jgi:hypothetical protein
MTTDQQPTMPAECVCETVDGNPIYVMVGDFVCEEHGHQHGEFVTIGLLDNDDDRGLFTRDDCRELIDLDFTQAISLARTAGGTSPTRVATMGVTAESPPKPHSLDLTSVFERPLSVPSNCGSQDQLVVTVF